MGFKDFKKDQGKIKEALNNLNKTLEPKSPEAKEDNRFWSLKPDDSGNGSAIIRLLPQQDTTKAPFVSYRQHSFKYKEKGFFCNCLNNIGEKCPICAYKNSIWEDNNSLARDMNAKTWYVGNILVIDDEVNPENNGKVFLFRFTNMLKPMIDKTNNPFLAIDRKKCKSEEDYNKKVAALREELEEENPKYLEWVDECGNVFDFFNGFDLKFTYSKTTINENGRQKTVNNYDDTKFIRKGKPVDKSEKKQEEIYDSLYDLDAYIKEMEYKSKEDLETLLDKCLNASYTTLKPTHKNEEETPKNARKEFQESKSNSSDDDDDLDFDKLMDEDDIPF